MDKVAVIIQELLFVEGFRLNLIDFGNLHHYGFHNLIRKLSNELIIQRGHIFYEIDNFDHFSNLGVRVHLRKFAENGRESLFPNLEKISMGPDLLRLLKKFLELQKVMGEFLREQIQNHDKNRLVTMFCQIHKRLNVAIDFLFIRHFWKNDESLLNFFYRLLNFENKIFKGFKDPIFFFIDKLERIKDHLIEQFVDHRKYKLELMIIIHLWRIIAQ